MRNLPAQWIYHMQPRTDQLLIAQIVNKLQRARAGLLQRFNQLSGGDSRSAVGDSSKGHYGFRPVPMIICAGILIWLFGKKCRTASSVSWAWEFDCSGDSVANFSRSLPDVSERTSQNCSGEIDAAILNLITRSLTSTAPASPRIRARLPGSANRKAPGAFGSTGCVSRYRATTSVIT